VDDIVVIAAWKSISYCQKLLLKEPSLGEEGDLLHVKGIWQLTSFHCISVIQKGFYAMKKLVLSGIMVASAFRPVLAGSLVRSSSLPMLGG
jgi:hypothetical protein